MNGLVLRLRRSIASSCRLAPALRVRFANIALRERRAIALPRRAGVPPRERPGRRAELVVGGAVLLAALLAALLVPTYPNYDTYFHLVWGREILAGHLPAFTAYAAPTEHPLFLAACTLLDLIFGGWADRALVLVSVACFVALVWAVLRVGRACFGFWPGLVAALLTGSSFAFLLYAARAYVDVPFLAAVLWAAALEAERPRRGASVAALLAVAGLLRPEAWVLAGAYWLWCGWRRRNLLALALAGPVLWALTDLVVTGDPLFSLHATSSLAEDLQRERGLVHVPTAFVSFLADTARPPVFAAGLAGLVLIAVEARTRPGPWLRRLPGVGARALPPVHAAHVPLALFFAGALTFAGSGLAGLSILPRYLTVPAVALCLAAGYAVAGATRLPPGRLRTLWGRAGIAAAVLGAAFLVVKLGSFRALAGELRFIDRTHADVAALARDPAAGSCRPITMPTYRLVPDLRFELDAPGAVAARNRAGPGRLRVFVAGDEKAVKRFGQADGVPRRTNRLPAGAPRARHGFLVAYGVSGRRC
jgi:hypothetical protein